MRHIVKNLISVVLIFAIVLGTVSICNYDLLNVKSYAENFSSGGQCGEKAYWTFDGTKLVVGGTGEMYEYDPTGDLAGITKEGDNCVPWRGLREKVKNIEIGNGITNVTDWAFEGFVNLISVSISGTVEYIGRDAFEACSKLSDVHFNEGLKEIGSWAFIWCTSLESIEFPASLKSIDRAAFQSCGIKEITIPETLEVLGRNAFTDCINLEKVNFPQNTEVINRGVFSGCTSLKKIDLPEHLKGIGRETFYGCTGLAEISIPDSVEAIGMSTFYDCTNLNKIKMSKNITEIDMEAFYNTGYYNNASNWEDGNLYIDNYLIVANADNSRYYIKPGTLSVARRAFLDSKELTDVFVPSSVRSLSAYFCTNCENLENIIILGKETMMVSPIASNEEKLIIFCYMLSPANVYAQNNNIRCVYWNNKAGDANNDRSINSSDALKVLQFSVGQITDIDSTYASMDVNEDNVINSSDALIILQYSVGMKNTVPTKIDKDNFCNQMAHILEFGREYQRKNPVGGYSSIDYFDLNYKDYDCQSENAFEQAFVYMLGSPYYPLYEKICTIYNINSETIEIKNSEKDPKLRMVDSGNYYYYYKVKGEFFDKYLSEIFNVSPDHSFELGKLAYYYDGYYYIKQGDGGDGSGPDVAFVDLKECSDGKYEITIKYNRGNDWGYAELATLKVITELKYVDGKNIWSIYKITNVTSK